MPRYRLTIEYDGTGLVGWQRQDNGPSVQQALEQAIEGFCGHGVIVQGAGRTDAGVHATGQCAHVSLEKDWPADQVRDAANAHLRPAAVSVLTAEVVPDDFDARFSATGRSYRYVILNRRSPPALEAGRVWWVSRPLDTDAMHRAAQELVGHHDFTSFRSTQCQAKSPVKTLDRLDVRRTSETIEVSAEARSFLHNQVRAMVGTLELVGRGKWDSKAVKTALEARDRSAAGPNAPPHGLYLSDVRYPAEILGMKP